MDKTNLNSQAIILLTAYFNVGDKPLTITEYGKFAKWLLSKERSPSDLLEKNAQEIIEGYEEKKVTPERLLRLLDRGNAMAIAMQKWQNAGIWVLTRADKEYPYKLKKILGHKAPPILYGAGEKRIFRTKGVAIIGSRNVSETDTQFTFSLGEKLAYCGYSVVSGGAKGVDEASMMGSINAGGTTIGVVADGLMQKVLSRKYRDAIMNGNLVLISPYFPEARFNVGNAMGRNKYIYVLAESSIVIHSGLKGGTWEGAKENLKHNWVPLFVKENNDVEAGNKKLIEMGGMPLQASILESENIDFLFEVKQEKSEASVTEGTSPASEEIPNKEKEAVLLSLEEKILDLLGKQRLPIKEIAAIVDEDEKIVKKNINKMVKSGEVQKHRNRPLQFSKIMKLPGMELM
jgi:predicted Rossmann fold nucleotide-binding protein DprA/Smf involved in DNA uptake